MIAVCPLLGLPDEQYLESHYVYTCRPAPGVRIFVFADITREEGGFVVEAVEDVPSMSPLECWISNMIGSDRLKVDNPLQVLSIIHHFIEKYGNKYGGSNERAA